MHGDWIKMRVDLYRDPRVCMMADSLMQSDSELARYVSQNTQRDMSVTRNVLRNACCGALVTVWGVMRLRGKCEGVDLVCAGAMLEVIDDIAEIPGFGDAMLAVGWVVDAPGGLVFERFFEDYNVDPESPGRTSAAIRQKRYRDKKRIDANDVKRDVTSDVTRDVAVTDREEKSREELTTTSKTKAARAAPSSAVAAVNFRQVLAGKGIPEAIAADWLTLRKAKHAPVTATALQGIEREAAKAGLSLSAALAMCCERGWTGFKAEWVAGNNGTQRNGNSQTAVLQNATRNFFPPQEAKNDAAIIDITPATSPRLGR